MKFIFWQNIVSIHQSAFIKALSRQHIVTLVAEQGLDSQRMMEKWDIPSMGEAEILVSPSNDEIESLLSGENVVHVFSGIDAYPMVYRAFKRAVALEREIVVLAEPYDWIGLKGKIRQLKYRWLFLRYGKYIRHFFTTGNIGVMCYKKAGFPEQRLHQWGYFTEQEITTNQNHKSGNKPNMIFVGKLDERKNILALVDAALEIKNLLGKFQIVGTGHLLPEVMKKIAGHKSISYLGVLPNEEVMELISQNDLLVLPSLFDGWGAVVNEALGKGTRVLCSDMVGASILLDNDKRGGCFQLNDPQDLRKKLEFWLCKGSLTDEDRLEIQQWATVNISGETASRYFCEALKNNEGNGVVAPWVSTPLRKDNRLISRLLYVGRLDANKNIVWLLKNIDDWRGISKFTIIGDGPLQEECIKLARKNPKIEMLGRLPNNMATAKMEEHDYLILPSLYDGWGAVVNEALSVGTRVLCSENCGASILLDGVERGEAFKLDSVKECLGKWLNKGPLSSSERAKIKNWANSHISGEVAAEYFVGCFSNEKMKAPWLI